MKRLICLAAVLVMTVLAALCVQAEEGPAAAEETDVLRTSTMCNVGDKKNFPLIYKEVTENLVFNGIKEARGKKYYDFSYNGITFPMSKGQVPEPITNYLIYELAFFRAGFGWGAYFSHKCDAMHFTLTELGPEPFENGPYAMRKVYEYADKQTGSAFADTVTVPVY